MTFTHDLKEGVNPYKTQFFACLNYLRFFLKNPVEAIKSLPNWNWPTLLAFYSSFAAASGLLHGLISGRLSRIFAGIIILPISASLGAACLTAFLYYFFQFVFKHEINLRKLFTIVALANLPFFALYILSALLPPLNLIGFATTGLILILGLSTHTPVDKKKITKLILSMYTFYFVFWAINMISFRSETKKYKDMATPESFEKLKEEFGSGE